MSVMSFITSLISIGSWIESPIYTTLLFFDAMVYWLISYAYNLFILMCTINYSSLYGLVSNILDELQAVVLVFVVFKLGISLIKFLLKPDDAAKEGSQILINIFITAALLISYNFIFTLFSELGMLLIGNPTGTPYVVLSQVANVTAEEDEGLITRLALGKASTDEENQNVGDWLALSTASIFMHDYGAPERNDTLRAEICKEGQCDFTKIPNLATKVNRQIEYHYGISFLCSVYLVFSLVKTSIQIGIRMFKLLILQILAPIAIISIIEGGLKAKIFTNFYKKYISVFIEAFTRMFTMLITVVFVSKFFINVKDYFPKVNSDDGVTVFLLTVLVIIAAFKFAGDIPKFIDEILGTHMSSGNDKNFLGGLLGAGLGAAGGFIGGFAGGGIGGALAGATKGALSGGQSGAKGNNIAEFFKGQKTNMSNQKALGQNIRAKGGLVQSGLGAVQSAVGVGSHQDKQLAKLDAQSNALDAYAAAQTNAIKEQKMGVGDDVNTYRYNSQTGQYDAAGTISAASQYQQGYASIKLGEEKSDYASQLIEYDNDYVTAKSQMAAAEASGNAAQIEQATQNLEIVRSVATKRAEDYYDYRKANIESDGNIEQALRDDVRSKRETYNHLGGNMQPVNTSKNNVKTEKQRIYKAKAQITNRSSYARTHGQNPNKK